MGPQGAALLAAGDGRASVRASGQATCLCAHLPTPVPALSMWPLPVLPPVKLPRTSQAFIAGQLKKSEKDQEETGCTNPLSLEPSVKLIRCPCPSFFLFVRRGFLVSTAVFAQVTVSRRRWLSPALEQTVWVQALAPPSPHCMASDRRVHPLHRLFITNTECT